MAEMTINMDFKQQVIKLKKIFLLFKIQGLEEDNRCYDTCLEEILKSRLHLVGGSCSYCTVNRSFISCYFLTVPSIVDVTQRPRINKSIPYLSILSSLETFAYKSQGSLSGAVFCEGGKEIS